MIFQQNGYQIRCEWGTDGLEQLAAVCDALIIVDVLSFSTCVAVATERGALVYPYGYKDNRAVEFAAEQGAILADKRSHNQPSLSPASLQHPSIDYGTKLVLPSPNGATLSTMTQHKPTYAACLRNATATAHQAQRHGATIGVIPAGERWRYDGTPALRVALEDWLGAGAVIAALTGTKSPEAQAAEAVFRAHQPTLLATLQSCISGQELAEAGFMVDVALAAEYDVSGRAPRLVDGLYYQAD